jgi:hypothetical protein
VQGTSSILDSTRGSSGGAGDVGCMLLLNFFDFNEGFNLMAFVDV